MKKKILLGLIAVLLLSGGFVAWKFLGPTVKTPANKYFYIPTGSSFADVMHSLDTSGIVGGKRWLKWTSDIVGYTDVKPGKYEIRKGMSLLSLVRMLKNGQQAAVNFVITKIRTKEVLAGRAGRQFEFDSVQMIEFLNNPDSLSQFGLDSNTAMAAVLPLTYTSYWNTSPGKLFREFYRAYQNFWTDERKSKASSLGLDPIKVTTIASIIDEETNAASDKPKIASVYLNRVAKGMPLQADPTLKFALKRFDLRRIYNIHTQFESPYNTYINKGLPPGPICTPLSSTIDSVLNSPKTEYIYFVASPAFDGSHVFTTNYEDHMKEAKLYHAELNRRKVK